MKFTCTKENLSNALSMISGIANRQTNLPILANVLIQATEAHVELISTDLEVAIKTIVRARIETAGTFTVPAKTLLDYISLVDNEQIDVSVSGHELILESGGASTKIKGEPSDDYPVIPDIIEDNPYTVLASPFKEALSQSVFAAAKNEIRPELSGVYFGFYTERFAGLLLAATDSYRLVEKRVSVAQGTTPFTCIIPARTVHEMIRLISAGGPDAESQVQLWVSERQLSVRYGQSELTSRLIDGQYPDYTQIIPQSFATTAMLPVSSFVKSVKAASLFSNTGVNAVSIDLDVAGGGVNVSSANTQTGEHVSKVDAQMQGEENAILLNHRYILDGLSHIQTDEVQMHLNSSDAPCLFSPKDSTDYLYIVMPIRQ